MNHDSYSYFDQEVASLMVVMQSIKDNMQPRIQGSNEQDSGSNS
jgi:hypothetical protein